MELVFISNGQLLHLHYLATWVSILVVVGGVYGAIRLLIDLWRWGRRPYMSGRRPDPPK